MMRRTLLALLASLVLIPSTTPIAASKRAITETDLLKFTWIADPQISPDGASVAFVKVVVNEKENRYETSLYTVPASGGDTRRLTSGIRDTGPRWSPDGKSIAFVRSIEKDGKPQAGQIYLLRMDGGEARPLTDVARGASGPEWSPDGKRIAFTAATDAGSRRTAATHHPRARVYARARGLRSAGAGPSAAEKAGSRDRVSDVKVITRAVYRANGNPGYVDDEHHAHVFVVRAPEEPADKPVPEQITDGEFDERGLAWAPDGTKVYFTSTRVAEPYFDPQHSELYSVPAAGGPITKVAAHRRDDQRRVGFTRRQADRVSRHAARQSGALLQPAGSFRHGRRTRRHAEEPDRRLRLRRARRDRRRSSRAARQQSEADRVVRRRVVADHRVGRAWQLKFETREYRHREDGTGH